MKISLLEPIGVPGDMIAELSARLTAEGHIFTYYDTKNHRYRGTGKTF